jgi:hypothetical protein
MLRDKEIDISLGIDKLFDRETAIAARHRELSAEMLTETDPAMLAAHTKQQASCAQSSPPSSKRKRG